MCLLRTSLVALVLASSAAFALTPRACSAAALLAETVQGEAVVQIQYAGDPFKDREGPFRMRRWTVSADPLPERLLGTAGQSAESPQSEEALTRATSLVRDRMVALTSAISARLQHDLGPAWRVRANESLASRDWSNTQPVATHAGVFFAGRDLITLDGPLGAGGRDAVQRAVVAATEAHLTARDAEALPPSPERVAAEAKAKELNAEAEQAINAIRIDTRILQLQHAVGEDVAKALKTALPWGSFATVGGTQIVASATATELAAAVKLSQQLDQIAMEQNERQKMEYAESVRSSPAGRLLSAPLNIDFKGGSVFDYLNMLAGVANTRSWIVEDPRVLESSLPAIKLTGVTVDSALKLLDGMSITMKEGDVPKSVPLLVRRIDADRDSGAPPIYRIGSSSSGTKAPSVDKPAPPTITEVFDVSLTKFSEDPEGKEKIAAAHDVLLAALEAGMSMDGPSKAFKVKLHAPSGMLFVSGTPLEAQLARNIVQQWQSVQ